MQPPQEHWFTLSGSEARLVLLIMGIAILVLAWDVATDSVATRGPLAGEAGTPDVSVVPLEPTPGIEFDKSSR